MLFILVIAVFVFMNYAQNSNYFYTFFLLWLPRWSFTVVSISVGGIHRPRIVKITKKYLPNVASCISTIHAVLLNVKKITYLIRGDNLNFTSYFDVFFYRLLQLQHESMGQLINCNKKGKIFSKIEIYIDYTSWTPTC